MTDKHTGFFEIAPLQANVEVAINDALLKVAQSVHLSREVDMTSDVSLVWDELLGTGLLNIINNVAAQTLTVPEKTLLVDNETMMVINNTGAFDVTVTTDNAAPSTVTIPANKSRIVFLKGNSLIILDFT